MATIGSGSPLLYVEGTATNIGGSGNTRTVKITAKFKVNGSSNWWYGYACNWRARVNNTYGTWTAIKGTESWNGGQALRTFEQTLTVDVGTSASKDITVGIYTDSQGDNGWDGSYTWNHKVGATNVAPVLSGNVTADGTTGNKIVNEKLSTIALKWAAASDANNNLSGYRVRCSINGGGYTEIHRGASTNYNHNVSGYGEGTTFKYVVDAYDSAGAWSSNIYSGTITKNKFTQDSITSTSSILFGTTTIAFTYSGGTNTQSGVSITRTLSCNGITVYNPNITASPINLKIWRSGEATPAANQPYIKFDDIKRVVANTNNKGKGVLNFTLTSKNSNGTIKTSSKAINVNLQANPNNTSASISLVQAESTNYLSIASSTTSKYFIPDGTKVTRVKWSAVTGKLGESVTYQVYVAYGSGGWTKIADLPTGTTYYNHAVPVQTVSQQFKYKIRVISTYNADNFSEAITSAQTLHFYNQPSLTQGNITRAATTADVVVTIKSNSSVPNINTKGTWAVYKSGTTTPIISSGNLTQAQTAQNIKVTNLTDAGTYDLKVTYNDNTGYMESNKATTIKISANLPLLFINKYGIGVNGVQASSSNALNVKGGAYISGTLNATNLQVGGNNVYSTNRKPTPVEIGAMADGGTYKTITLSNWISTTGSTGWKNSTYGGGWFMQDSTWIRALNNKGIHTGGNLSITGNGEFGGYLKTNRVAVGNTSPTDLADGAPWYGIGKATVNLGSDRTECIQVSGYFGLRLRSSKTVVDLRPDDYVLVMGHLCPHVPRKYWLGTNSPDRQWKGLCAEGGTVGASDGRVKENMIRLDGTRVFINEDNKLDEVNMLNNSLERALPEDYYNFIKDRFIPTYYNYKLSDFKEGEAGFIEDEKNMLKNIGFIAQDYDLKLDKVAQEFIIENSDGSLMYNHMSYVTVGLIALQESTKKIEKLENENKKLKNEMLEIKKHLGLS